MVRSEEDNVPCRVCNGPVRAGAATCREHSVAANASRPTAVPVASLPLRASVAAGAPPAAAARRPPIGLGRAAIVIALAGGAWYATGHLHQSQRAAAAAGSLLARPILEPVCQPWHQLAAHGDRSREQVVAEAGSARAPFEQARELDPNAGLDDAVNAVQFLDSLQEPGQAAASEVDVDRAVSVVD